MFNLWLLFLLMPTVYGRTEIPTTWGSRTAPMELRQDLFIVVPDGRKEEYGGHAVFYVKVNVAGNVKLECLSNGKDGNSNSFFLEFDNSLGNSGHVFETPVQPNFQWKEVVKIFI